MMTEKIHHPFTNYSLQVYRCTLHREILDLSQACGASKFQSSITGTTNCPKIYCDVLQIGFRTLQRLAIQVAFGHVANIVFIVAARGVKQARNI
jgi:hypothetical protein